VLRLGLGGGTSRFDPGPAVWGYMAGAREAAVPHALAEFGTAGARLLALPPAAVSWGSDPASVEPMPGPSRQAGCVGVISMVTLALAPAMALGSAARE